MFSLSMTIRARRWYRRAQRKARKASVPRAATLPPPKTWGKPLPSAPRRRELPKWFSIAAATCITAESRRWPRPRAKADCSSKHLIRATEANAPGGELAEWKTRVKDANRYEETGCRTIPAQRSGGRHQPCDQGRQRRQESFLRGPGGGRRSVIRGRGLWLGQGEGSSPSHPQGNRVGQEEPDADQSHPDHDPPSRAGTLRLGPRAVEARTRRHGRHCRRGRARRHDVGGNSERAHEVDWHDQSP